MQPKRAKPGKFDKLPINPLTGAAASSTDRTTWSTFNTALAYCERQRLDGVLYALTLDDGLTVVDFDNCRNAATGALDEQVAADLKALASYAEISPSGTGIHVWIRGVIPTITAKGVHEGNVEIYSKARFMSVTGNVLPDYRTLAARQEALGAFYTERIGQKRQAKTRQRAERLQRGSVTLDDKKLLAQARQAKNGADFKALYDNGNWADYASQSEADLALCNHLAFWTHGDSDRIDRLFRVSALMREKWDRGDYRTETIEKACARATESAITVPSGAASEPGAHNDLANGEPDEKRKLERPPDQATRLVKLVEDKSPDLFHDAEDVAYATFQSGQSGQNGGHKETWPLRSDRFRTWLRRLLYDAEGRSANAQAIQDAIATLESKALFEGPCKRVWLRLAEADGAIYLDLGDEAWQAVKIDASGWQIVSEAPVRFRRRKGMLALPKPQLGGSITDLRPFLNVADDSDFYLVVAFLLASLRPSGPYPVLMERGEQGSAKTTTARVIRALVDPNSAPVRAEPRENRDLAIAAGGAWMVAFDNLSGLPKWLSDALCRLSTGGGFATRTLYSDDDETIFYAQRPVILTGIDAVITRSDLLDRALMVSLPIIFGNKRKAEAAFWRDFEAKRPAILGALLMGVARAIRELATTILPELPRMADFALWVCAAEQGLGWRQGAFMDAYTANRAAANDVALESSAVASAIVAFMADKPTWEGTPTDLLKALTNGDDNASDSGDEGDSHTTHSREDGDGELPSTPNTFSRRLNRILPNLRAVGITVGQKRLGNVRTRLITLERHPTATPAIASPEKGGKVSSASSVSSADAAPSDHRSLGSPEYNGSHATTSESMQARRSGRYADDIRAGADDMRTIPRKVSSAGVSPDLKRLSGPTADDTDDADDTFPPFSGDAIPACSATSTGVHVYARLRTPDHRRVCVECGEPEPKMVRVSPNGRRYADQPDRKAYP